MAWRAVILPLHPWPSWHASTHEFRIDFHAERVVEADDVHTALQQAELAGATVVTAIVRQ